jgi:hypothetical protein
MNIRLLVVTSCVALSSQAVDATGWWDLLFNNDSSSSYSAAADAAAARVSTMSDSQMRSYVRQLCRAFGYQLTLSEVSNLEDVIIRTITNDSNCYQSGRYSGYIKDKVDQYINSGLIQYIEEYAYSYAYRKLGNSNRAQAIAESMRNNALALVMQNKSGTTPAAQMGQFIGSSLKKAVDYELASTTQQSYPQTQYDGYQTQYDGYQTRCDSPVAYRP